MRNTVKTIEVTSLEDVNNKCTARYLRIAGRVITAPSSRTHTRYSSSTQYSSSSTLYISSSTQSSSSTQYNSSRTNTHKQKQHTQNKQTHLRGNLFACCHSPTNVTIGNRQAYKMDKIKIIIVIIVPLVLKYLKSVYGHSNASTNDLTCQNSLCCKYAYGIGESK